MLVARDDEARALRVRRLGAIEEHFDALPFDAAAARECGRLHALVAQRGGATRRRAMDLAIAATANVQGVLLRTYNIKTSRSSTRLTSASLETGVYRPQIGLSANEVNEIHALVATRRRTVGEIDGWMSMNFSNTSGALWALIQRAIINAGFALDPDRISVLDKGHVKSRASHWDVRTS